MEHVVLYCSKKLVPGTVVPGSRQELLLSTIIYFEHYSSSSTGHMFTYHSTHITNMHMQCQHACKWSAQTWCAIAAVPWLPQSRELGSLRHGVIQT